MATTRTRSGHLNQPVRLDQVQRVPDGGGGYEESWVPVATVWARVEALTGEESLQAGQQESTVGYHVTIRWRDGLTGALSVVWRTRRLNVVYVADNGPAAEFIRLDCQTEGPR